MDDDDLRHRRGEEHRKEKRRQNRENRSASQLEKQKLRKAHNQKVIDEANKNKGRGRPLPPSHKPSHKKQQSRRPPPPSEAPPSSKFQALFAKRAKGFLIDLNFRNAPPRPPVGPCFVGLGLEGELNDKWTRYKPDNAIERQYVWKLHAEPDLGIPLAPSAMDYEGCYFDPTKKRKKTKTDNEMDVDTDNESDIDDAPILPPKLHPDDAKLVDWKGDQGDSVLKELHRRRDRARALLKHGGSTTTPAAPSSTSKSTKSHFSRVLRGVDDFFMKKTTYLSNDQGSSVHKFRSLEKAKIENAKEIQKKMKDNERKLSDKDGIEEAFEKANRVTERAAKHPKKRGVEAVYEVPFLPDARTWGHTYTHVVVDHLPKTVVPFRRSGERRPVTRKTLEKAFIADVTRPGENVRMECNLLLPDANAPPAVDAGGKEGDVYYDASLAYVLDLQPLQEEGKACVNFLLTIDEKNGVATYHPVSTKVQLSTGRKPGSDGGLSGGKKRLGRFVGRREMGSEDVNEMEGRLGEIDRDFGGDEEDGEQDSESDDSE